MAPEIRATLYVDAVGTPIPGVSSTELWNFLIGRLVGAYLGIARTVEAGVDAAAFDSLMARLEQECLSGVEEIRVTLPLPGLDLPDGELVVDDGLSLRLISDEERQRWIAGGMIDFRDPLAGRLRAAIDVRFNRPRVRAMDEQYALETAASERARLLLLSIQLLADTGVAPLFTETRSLSVLAMGIAFSSNAYLRPTYAAGEVRAEMIESLRTTMTTIATDSGIPSRDLALRRWTDMQWRVRADDQIIDCWIALEAILCHGSTQEVQFRAALRLAALIGKPDERQTIYDEARASYQCRSRRGSLADRA